MRALYVLFGALLSAGTASAGPLDKPPFTATPQELLAEARAVAGMDADVVVLRDDMTIRYDAAGRAEHRYRVVAAILKPRAVDEWGTVSVDWRPFYQERPTIKARVIAPDGTVAEIDPSLFHDAPVVSESPSVFSDRRDLEAPLPRLSVGAVFEEEMVIREREPLLAEGEVERMYGGRSVPVQRTVVTIEAPTKRAIKLVTRGFAKTPPSKQVTQGGRTTWTYDLGATAAIESYDQSLPGELTAFPYVGVTTGKDWASIAAGYRRLVEAKMNAPFTRPPGLEGATQRATVDRTLAWLHANVRYTGIELQDSAIIPYTPAETIKRGFGDCKDKAALLAALLRASGIPADLALVSTGPGNDVDRGLPGMGPFDHAIVRAKVDGKDLWIDATEDELPAGQLPARDQGRLALVISSDARDLTMTPASKGSDNVIREVRTYALAESDWASVREVTTESGVYWNNLRGWTRNTKRADVAKSLGEYTERQYGGELRSFTANDPGDVTKPFEMIVEVDKVNRAYTAREAADVYLYPTDTMSRLPELVDSNSKELDEAVSKRTADYVWYVPHVSEIENRLIIPAGHTAPPVNAKSEKRVLGTMTLTTTRRTVGDALVITYRLDTGPRRITAAQLRATRDAVKAFRKENGEHVVVAQNGATLLAAGKIDEAVAEYKRLIALHPKEGLHHGQLAEAYSKIGMGTAARRSAQRRVELEPKDADGYVVLAVQLQRDSVGRNLGFDADRTGAIAAYRKALALNPTHVGALEGLAWLLTTDRRGWPITEPRDLLEAVELWKRANSANEDTEHAFSIAETLLEARRYADAESAARDLPRSDEAAGIQIAAVAAARGAPAAITLARSLASGADRTRVLVEARARLLGLRLYDEMRAVHAELGASSTTPTEATMIRALKKIDLNGLDRADPRTAVLHSIRFSTGVEATYTPWDAATGDVLAQAARMTVSMANMAELQNIPQDAMVDMFVAMATLGVEGDAKRGWRVSAALAGEHAYYYVRLQKGRAEVVGFGGVSAGLGREILARLAAKDVDGARRWLQLFVEDVGRVSVARSPLVGAVQTLYNSETAAGALLSRDAAEVAAALLQAEHADKSVMPVLRRCAVTDEIVQQACKFALMSLLMEHAMWKEAAEVAKRLRDDPSNTGYRARALVMGGHHAEGLAMLDKAIAARPKDAHLVAERAYLTVEAEGFAKAEPWFERAASHPNVSEIELNTLSWTRAFHDASMTRALELAHRAESSTSNLSPALANTLALIEAEAGHPYAAWKYVQKSHVRLAHEPPIDDDWYVYGRIAEHLGLKDDAIAAYKRVGPQRKLVGVPTTREFAERALKRLGK